MYRRRMTVLQEFVAALSSGRIEVVDLTAPLSDQTPILHLPEPFGQTGRFALEEISRYDDRGPAWYWNNISTGEHTGTHFDAPIHWVTGRDGDGRRRRCRRSRLVAPAVGARLHRRGGRRPRLPAGDRARQGVGGRARRRCRTAAGCSTAPAGTRRSHDQERSSTPTRPAAHARHLGRVRPLAGRGVADPGRRRGDGRHRRRRRALVRPAVPVPLVPARRGQVRPDPAAEPGRAAADRRGGHRRRRCRSSAAPAARAGCWRWSSGDGDRCRSPRRSAGARPRSASTTSSAWSAAATSTSPTRWSRPAPGSSRPRHEGGAATMADAYARVSGAVGVLSVHQGPGSPTR